jgi:hypothetical protein
MVSNARTPSRSIHPMIGSRFSASRDGTPSEAPPAIDELLFSSPAELDRKPAPETPPVRSQPRPAASEAFLQEAGKKPLETFEPLVAPLQESDEPAVAGLFHRPSVEQREPTAVDAEVTLQHPYQPLIDEVTPHAGARMAFRNSAAEASRTTRGSRSNFPGRSPQPMREPDEIEIHIGRIEVTAVPQPVARPLAPPARKSVNLEEYLKRRKGRR